MKIIYSNYEESIVSGISINNGRVNQIYEEKRGYGIKSEETNFTVYQASNELENKYFASVFGKKIGNKKQKCLECQHDEMKNYAEYIQDIMSNMAKGLKNIQHYHAMLLRKIFNKIVYLPQGEKYVEEETTYYIFNISLYIKVAYNTVPLNRQIIIQDYEDVRAAVEMLLEEIVVRYKRLSDKKIIDISYGSYDLILPRGIGGILMHEVIGHSLEADSFFCETSKIRRFFNKKICDTGITIVDSCDLRTPLHYEYSSDGTKAQSVKLIDCGVVSGILSDKITANQYGIVDTGNGRTNGYEYESIPRMRNTFLDNGCIEPEKIMEDTKYGILVNEIGGGQFINQTGEYSFIVNSGIQINRGMMTNFVMPFVIRGNIIDTLKRVTMIGNDLKFHAGTCNKLGQSVDVTYGQPTIKITSQLLTKS